MLKNRSFALLVVFLSGFWLCSMNIGGVSIYVLDEAKNATCAREMLEQEEWIIPTFNYELRGDKPPLHYYFMMLSYSVFGVNEWAARFFSAIMGALTILITFMFTDKYLGRSAAWLSTGVLCASIHFTLQFHLAVPDPYLIFFLTLAIFGFFDFIHSRNYTVLYLMYISVAMGVLSKGPVAVALPGLVMLLYLLFSKRLTWENLRSFRILQGVIIVLLISVPWYWMVHLQTNGAWTDEFFFRHNVGRFTSTMEGHGGIFLLTPLYVLVGMLPFSVFFIQSMKKAWRDCKDYEILLIAFLQVVSFTFFFSISSTKLPNYTVPVYPFLSVMVGYYLSGKLKETTLSKADKWSLGVYVFLSIALPIGGYLGMAQDRLLSGLKAYAWLWLVIPAGAFLAGHMAFRNKFYSQGIMAIIASWILAAMAFYYIIFPKMDQQNPVFKNIDLFEPETQVAQYQFINRSFNFYIRKQVIRLETPAEVEVYWREHPGAYIITRAKYLEELSQIPGIVEKASDPDLFEKYTTVILALDKSANFR